MQNINRSFTHYRHSSLCSLCYLDLRSKQPFFNDTSSVATMHALTSFFLLATTLLGLSCAINVVLDTRDLRAIDSAYVTVQKPVN
jgi:hypothetical protein